MEIPHSDLSEVTWMVLVHVRPVVMLSTCETSSTRMLAVLAYSSMTGRDVSATISHYHQHLLSQSSSAVPILIAILGSAAKKGIFSEAVECVDYNLTPHATTNSLSSGRIRANLRIGGYVLLAGLAQVGRHLDVVLRDAVVVVIFSSTRKLMLEVLFIGRNRFRTSAAFWRAHSKGRSKP